METEYKELEEKVLENDLSLLDFFKLRYGKDDYKEFTKAEYYDNLKKEKKIIEQKIGNPPA